ncbi:ABC transporter permease [Miltoncostaea marina]|uniref:ABC transporter permease n=1 Tax=Miltoncostaea marina TaxID=2843215 RepID=UPI001C3D776C|nr:ABC transporter permease [Miltoncostaea marina]
MRRARAAAAFLGPAGLAGLGLLAAVALAVAAGPAISPYGAAEQELGARLQGPSWTHPFGTAELGEDVLTQTLVSGRVSLVVGLATALAATLVGAGLGLAAGWRGGWVDALLSRVTDLFLIVPAFVVLIVLSLAFERVGPAEVVLILALMSWPPLFRLARASAMRTRELPYVEAARAAGAAAPRVVLRHLLPAAAPEIASFGALAVGVAVLAESALSFLGLGIDPDGDRSWGAMASGAGDTLEEHPWLTLAPGLAIVVTVLAVSLIGEGVRRGLDPRATPPPRREGV